MKAVTYFQELLLNGGVNEAYVSTSYELIPKPGENDEDPVEYEQRWILILKHGDIQYSITQAQAEEEYNYVISNCSDDEKDTVNQNYQEVLSCLQ